MQQAEMQLKQAKFQHDKAMDEAELQLKTQALAKDQRENKRIDTQAEIEGAKIAIDSVEHEQKLQENRQKTKTLKSVRLGLEELILIQLRDQKSIADSLVFKPVEREVYLQAVGEIKGLQRIINYWRTYLMVKKKTATRTRI